MTPSLAFSATVSTAALVTPAAVRFCAMHEGVTIITDTNMALAGITKPGLAKLGGQAVCFTVSYTHLLLAARASCVVEMFCGLPTVLKGELPEC